MKRIPRGNIYHQRHQPGGTTAGTLQEGTQQGGPKRISTPKSVIHGKGKATRDVTRRAHEHTETTEQSLKGDEPVKGKATRDVTRRDPRNTLRPQAAEG